jgi:serine/threonine protein kinase
MLRNGAYGCIYRPHLNCDGHVSKNVKTRNDFVTKLQEDDHTARNEYRIGQMVKRIANYEYHFLPADKICKVKINKSLDHLQKCEAANMTAENKHYGLLTMPYKKGDGVASYLENKATSHREKLSIIFDVYLTLLNSLELLAKHRIIHFDLHSENIHFHTESGVPLIIDFGMSIAKDEPTKHDCMIFGPSADWWCIDIHMLSLLRKDREIYDFANECFTEDHFLFDVLSPEEMEQHIAAYSARIKEFANLDSETAQSELWKSWETWDNFSLSTIMLKIITILFGPECRTNDIMEGFIQLLVANIDPDSQKRHSIADTKRQFDQLFYSVSDPKVYLDMIRLIQGVV